MVRRGRQLFRRAGFTRIEVCAVLLVIGLGAWLLVPVIGANRSSARREACMGNLKVIGQALGAYLEASDQVWPYASKLRTFKLHDPPWPTLAEVLVPYLGGRRGVFHCPADARELEPGDELAKTHGTSTTYHETEGTSYEWHWSEAYGGIKVGQESLSRAQGFGFGRADQPLLADFEPFHEGDGGGAINTLFADLKARTARPLDGR